MSNTLKDLLCSTCKVITPKVHPEGIKFILIFALVTVILSMLSSFLGAIALILTIWCIYFFRDPERFTPSGDNLVISPADGIVSEISKDQNPPKDLDLDKKQKWQKISIFLNVFNVHVNRVPISGKITNVEYKEGKFLNANLKEASTHNEQNVAVVKTKNDQEVIFVQVAGLIARRIVSNLEEDQEVTSGDRYGIIRFGSRADIYLPEKTKIKVLEGQIMVGGETVLAELSNAKIAIKTSTKPITTKSADTKTTAKK
jgi:phosphatidylserine decarboxylase|tara:strand:- start:17179 stop:17949 length:771 start_codon:yes stop_codon:yes gene_type:complete